MNIKRELLVEKLIDYIKENFNNGFRINTFSQIYKISRQYLYVIFRERTGFSIREYINMLRIEMLKEILKENKHEKAYTIGIKIGFKNEFQLYRWVRKNFGITLNELKKNFPPQPSTTLKLKKTIWQK